jgi:hypothetical protein
MLGEHPAIDIPQSTAYAKEMRRHEALHTRYGGPGRPYVYAEYPKLLYKCEHVAGKGIQVVDKHEVSDEDQERNLNSRGFYPLKESYERAEKQQTEFGRLAAEREFEIQHGRISAKAADEVRVAEEAHGSMHMPVVPEGPKKRGRKPRSQA